MGHVTKSERKGKSEQLEKRRKEGEKYVYLGRVTKRERKGKSELLEKRRREGESHVYLWRVTKRERKGKSEQLEKRRWREGERHVSEAPRTCLVIIDCAS